MFSLRHRRSGLAGLATSLLLCLLTGPGLSSGGFCPELCTCDDLNLIVTCIKADLHDMPNTLNPNLKTVVYKYNDFDTVDVSFMFLRKLLKADLSNNNIVSLRPATFQAQGLMRQLNLESNKVGDINNKTFKGLNSLEVLSLRNNLIEVLHPRLFVHAPNLKEVDLARNRISAIHPEAFQAATALRLLDLSDNELRNVPSDALANLPDLAELSLAGNPLKTIVSDVSGVGAFSYFTGLQSLDLASSRLRSLRKNTFRGLGTLRHLGLADNNLSSVPTEAFRHLPHLESLDVGRNPFVVITPHAFQPLAKLKKLEMSGCGRLEAIRADAFAGLVDLEHVTISLNRRLASIAEDAFDATPELRLLDLADNGLQTVPSALVPWRQLSELDVSGNRWRCDCNLMSLGEALAGRNITDAKCASPPGLRHYSVADLYRRGGSAADMLQCGRVRHEPIEAEFGRAGVGGEDGGGEGAATLTVIVLSAAALVLLVVVLLVLLVHCRHRLRNWVKELPFRPAGSSPGGSGRDQVVVTAAATADQYGAPYRHHQYRQPSLSYDDEHYYYVATLQNRMASGKDIPVTEI